MLDPKTTRFVRLIQTYTTMGWIRGGVIGRYMMYHGYVRGCVAGRKGVLVDV